MSREFHISGARDLLAKADKLFAEDSIRLGGEALWGASCDAILALAHIVDYDHSGGMSIRDYKRVIREFIDANILDAGALDAYDWSVIPLHHHFYRRGLARHEIVSHAIVCRGLIEEMLAIRVLDEGIDGA